MYFYLKHEINLKIRFDKIRFGRQKNYEFSLFNNNKFCAYKTLSQSTLL